MTDFVAVAGRLVDAYNAGDLDAVERGLSPTIDFAHYNRGFTTQSRDELLAVLRQFAHILIPDRKFSAPTRVTTSGSTVVRQSRWSGTAQADIPGLCKAGDAVDLHLCSVLTFDETGVVVEWKDYG
jgi:hypothetical protein